ncbi:uncharacterized protein LOC130814246 isoform X2 [Amaranthus tricolor]|uniref:uncharacterized protein LOC130814246 isoform X2 n=1 Tax=Amaranthus tricolor TaxID=29722 RepID=UPI00258F239B|nr:uncharacterized protein LOC130814246 isoform X2 [Amaranthus tricolor]
MFDLVFYNFFVHLFHGIVIFMAPKSEHHHEVLLVKFLMIKVYRTKKGVRTAFSIIKLKSKTDKVQKGGETVNGCVLILLVAFCYRYHFQGRHCPKSIPLIKYLTN